MHIQKCKSILFLYHLIEFDRKPSFNLLLLYKLINIKMNLSKIGNIDVYIVFI